MDWIRSRRGYPRDAPINEDVSRAKLELYPSLDLTSAEGTMPTSSTMLTGTPSSDTSSSSTPLPLNDLTSSSAQPTHFISEIAVLFRRYHPTQPSISPFVPVYKNVITPEALDGLIGRSDVSGYEGLEVVTPGITNGGVNGPEIAPVTVTASAQSFNIIDNILERPTMDFIIASLLGAGLLVGGVRSARKWMRYRKACWEEMLDLHRTQARELTKGLSEIRRLTQGKTADFGGTTSAMVARGTAATTTPLWSAISNLSPTSPISDPSQSPITSASLSFHLANLKSDILQTTAQTLEDIMWKFMHSDDPQDWSVLGGGISDRLDKLQKDMSLVKGAMEGRPLLDKMLDVGTMIGEWEPHSSPAITIQGIKDGTLKKTFRDTMAKLHDSPSLVGGAAAWDHPFRRELQVVHTAFWDVCEVIEACHGQSGGDLADGPLARVKDIQILADKVEALTVAKTGGPNDSVSIKIIESKEDEIVATGTQAADTDAVTTPVKRKLGRPRKVPATTTGLEGTLTMVDGITPGAAPATMTVPKEVLSDLVTKEDLRSALEGLQEGLDDAMHSIAYDSADSALGQRDADINLMLDRRLKELNADLNIMRRQMGQAKPLMEELRIVATQLDAKRVREQTELHGPKMSSWDQEERYDRAHALEAVAEPSFGIKILEVLEFAQEAAQSLKTAAEDSALKDTAAGQDLADAINQTRADLDTLNALSELLRSKEVMVLDGRQETAHFIGSSVTSSPAEHASLLEPLTGDDLLKALDFTRAESYNDMVIAAKQALKTYDRVVSREDPAKEDMAEVEAELPGIVRRLKPSPLVLRKLGRIAKLADENYAYHQTRQFGPDSRRWEPFSSKVLALARMTEAGFPKSIIEGLETGRFGEGDKDETLRRRRMDLEASGQRMSDVYHVEQLVLMARDEAFLRKTPMSLEDASEILYGDIGIVSRDKTASVTGTPGNYQGQANQAAKSKSKDEAKAKNAPMEADIAPCWTDLEKAELEGIAHFDLAQLASEGSEVFANAGEAV